VDNLRSDKAYKTSTQKYIQKAIDLLEEVPGMSIDKLKLHINNEPITTLKFSDGSGKLVHIVNAANFHHVYVFNEMNLCLFSGYVGWLHTDGLKQAIADIQKLFVTPNLSNDWSKIFNINH
jgi:hypothetical protein